MECLLLRIQLGLGYVAVKMVLQWELGLIHLFEVWRSGVLGDFVVGGRGFVEFEYLVVAGCFLLVCYT